MGSGTDAARALGNVVHAQVLDDFKDQLLVALLNRLKDESNSVVVPVAEVDGTGAFVVALAVCDGNFTFEVQRKS